MPGLACLSHAAAVGAASARNCIGSYTRWWHRLTPQNAARPMLDFLMTNIERMDAMSTIKTLTASTLAVVALVSLSACSDMSRRDRDMAIGAGVGGVAGSALTGGSALGT